MIEISAQRPFNQAARYNVTASPYFYSKKVLRVEQIFMKSLFQPACALHTSTFSFCCGFLATVSFFSGLFPKFSTSFNRGKTLQLRPVLNASSTAYCCYTCQAFTPARSNKKFPVESLSRCMKNYWTESFTRCKRTPAEGRQLLSKQGDNSATWWRI